ncbi:uncharacterized protein LOC128843758 [Malaclemys terrapin pileata]|uniref:uncharacterized protein LOC128843758 n=1 Tax=Malaclemys terrapin pileata TaxID=2991368 RepID=UPI0023A7BB48|nr:uncharacterized protein LOC128843758 [Malaclemys terrapin pileata]
MEGTSAAANLSSLPPPSRRLSQIRRRRKRTRDDMFTEIMECTQNQRAHLNEWKDTVTKFRKDASEREVLRDARDERWQAATLGLLREQTDMLRRLVELQEWQQDDRVPLQPLYNLPPPSPCFISSSPRRVRTRGGRLRAPSHSTPAAACRITHAWTSDATRLNQATTVEDPLWNEWELCSRTGKPKNDSPFLNSPTIWNKGTLTGGVIEEDIPAVSSQDRVVQHNSLTYPYLICGP